MTKKILNKKNKISQTPEHFDVIVVGGGLAGLTLCAMLGQDSVRVLCIDKNAPNFKTSKDMRTTAISYGSQKILNKAGIWEGLTKHACPITNIQILDGQSPVLLNFLSDKDAEGQSFGWVIDNAILRKAMSARISNLDTVTHIAPCEIKHFETHDSGVTLSTNNGDFTASLLVGADGRRSYVRDKMGVAIRHKDYKQRAIICAVSHKNPHEGLAVEHFQSTGPFAILPMMNDKNGTYRSAVVLTEHGKDTTLSTCDDATFETLVRARFPSGYGDVNIICERQAYPLSLSYALDYIAPRIALVGDAAHGIHPIAGQGLNLGFRDVAYLAELIGETKHNAQNNDAHDIGGFSLLRAYQRKRRPDNMAMIAFTDGLNMVFSNPSKSLSALRKLGLRASARFPAARDFFLKRTMGER